MTRSVAEDADGGTLPRQRVEAHDSAAVNVAGHDIYQLVDSPDRPRDRPGNVSVEPPFGRIDLPLRGRDELVSKIWPPAADPASGRGAVHVLYGLGGCGKSLVALEIARRARSAGQAVWWVSATGRTLIGASMREIAGRLGAPATQLEHAWSGVGRLPTEVVWDLLNAADQPWLLVFDNADDPRLLAPDGGRVTDGNGWVRQPWNATGMVVVTTRDGNRHTWGSWTARHPVRPLPADAAARVLLDVAGDRAGTWEQARRLATRLGGLPLALRGAGRYLELVTREPVLPDRSAIRTFGGYREALDRRSADPGTGRAAADHPDRHGLQLVHESFGPSLELLAERGPAPAVALLRVLACLAHEPVPFAALLDPDRLSASPLFPTLGGDQVRDALDALSDLAFVESARLQGVADPAYADVRTLHPLVRDMVREHEAVHRHRPVFDALVMNLLEGAASGVDPDDPNNWSRWSVLGPQCAGTVLDYVSSGHRTVREPPTLRQAVDLVRLTARYVLAIGQPRECEIFLNRCLRAIAISAIEVDETQALALRHELGRTALEQGRLPEAEHELRQVIAARDRLLGPGHPDTLASRHKLARAIMEQRRWDVAEAELQGIVAGEERVRGSEHPDTLTIRHSLARAVLAQGRSTEAEQDLRAILDVWLARSGEEHPETVGIRNSLARALMAQGRHAEAGAELGVVFERASPERFASRPEMLRARRTHARLRRARGDVAGAVEELRSLVADRREILGDNHPDTVDTIDELSELEGDLPAPRMPAGDQDDLEGDRR